MYDVQWQLDEPNVMYSRACIKVFVKFPLFAEHDDSGFCDSLWK
jgi:hypothetical protein